MLVRDVMTKDVACVQPSTTLAEAAKLMKERDIGVLPVARNKGLVGIVTDRDICCRAIADGLDPVETTVERIMSTSPATCSQDQRVDDAAKLMETKRVRRLPVVDQNAQLVGIMSLGDLSHHAPHKLAGEVEDRITRH